MRSTKKRRSVAIALSALLLVSGAAYYAGSHVQSERQAAAVAEPPPPTVLTESVRMGEMHKSIVFRAATYRAFTETIHPESADATSIPVVTALNFKMGQHTYEGSVVYEVAGIPCLFMTGTFPMYRDISRGMSGPDVMQLKKSLGNLGISVSSGDRLDRRTMQAYVALLHRSGYRGDINAPIKRGSIVFLQHVSGEITAINFRLGSIIDSSSEITISSGDYMAHGFVPEADSALFTLGMSLSGTEDLTGASSSGDLVKLGAMRADRQTGAPVREAVVRFPKAFVSEGTELRMSVDQAVTSGPVVSVPISAIRSAADGTSQIVIERSGDLKPTRVVLGVEADGWVEVLGVSGLLPSDRVVVG